MNCYPFEVNLPNFDDLLYEGQHLTNLVVSHQVEHAYSRHLWIYRIEVWFEKVNIILL